MEQLIDNIKSMATKVYKTLGGGYAETVYEESMAVEMRHQKVAYETERNTEIFYEGEKVGTHRLDFIVENKVVVELKATTSISKSHKGQLDAYLKTLGIEHGLIINFPYPDGDAPDFQIAGEG